MDIVFLVFFLRIISFACYIWYDLFLHLVYSMLIGTFAYSMNQLIIFTNDRVSNGQMQSQK